MAFSAPGASFPFRFILRLLIDPIFSFRFGNSQEFVTVEKVCAELGRSGYRGNMLDIFPRIL